eukprot:gene12384-6051_t
MKHNFDKYKDTGIPKFIIEPLEQVYEEDIHEIHYVEPNPLNYYYYENNEKKYYFKEIKKEINHYLIVRNNNIIEYRLKKFDNFKELNSSKELKIHLDSTGNHILILNQYEIYYLNFIHSFNLKYKIEKINLNTLIILSQWIQNDTLLFITNDLNIKLIKFKYLNKIKYSLIHLRDICLNSNEMIQDLKFKNDSNNYILFILTNQRLIYFNGIMNEYLILKYSIQNELNFEFKNNSKIQFYDDSFVCLTIHGILHGIIKEFKDIKWEHLKYPKEYNLIPNDLYISKYHLFLINSNFISIFELPSDLLNISLNLISLKKYFKNNLNSFFNDHFNSMNLLKNGILFLTNKNEIFKIKLNKEEHLEENDIWKIYLKETKKENDQVLKQLLFSKSEYLSMKSIINYLEYNEIVNIEKCKFLFSIKEYHSAIKILLKYPKRFKEFIHIFILKNEFNHLRNILLNNNKSKNNQISKIYLIWIIQLYLSELLFNKSIIDEFKSFLIKYNELLKDEYELINSLILNSSNSLDLFKFYLMINKRYDTLISIEMYNNSNIDNYYKQIEYILPYISDYSSNNDIDDLFNILIKKDINPLKLIQTMFNYLNKLNNCDSLICYLEWCLNIQNLKYPLNNDKKISIKDKKNLEHYLIYFYSKYNNYSLLTFLSNSNHIYDIMYALSITKRFNQMKSYCLLLSFIGEFEKGVKISLNLNHFDIAKRISNDECNDIKKKEILWGMIYNHYKLLNVDIMPNLPIFNLLKILNDDILIKDLNNKSFKKMIKNEFKTNNIKLTNHFNDVLKDEPIIYHDLYLKKCVYCKKELNHSLILSNYLYSNCNHSFHFNCIIDFILNQSIGISIQKRIKVFLLSDILNVDIITKLYNHLKLHLILLKECPKCESIQHSIQIPIGLFNESTIDFKSCIHHSKSTLINEISSNNLKDYFIKDTNLILFFYLPNCNFCNESLKILNQIKKNLNLIKNIQFGKVNSEKELKLKKEYKIDTFPSIK